MHFIPRESCFPFPGVLSNIYAVSPKVRMCLAFGRFPCHNSNDVLSSNVFEMHRFLMKLAVVTALAQKEMESFDCVIMQRAISMRVLVFPLCHSVQLRNIRRRKFSCNLFLFQEFIEFFIAKLSSII